jgi:hypothetical protein
MNSAIHQKENRSQSLDQLKDPLELTDQTPAIRLDRWLGIIAEHEGEINGRASS